MSRPTRLVAPRSTPFLILFALSAPLTVATAGDYHEGATLDCAECHVLHPKPLASALPRASERVGPLLKKDVNDLCLSCHDDSPRAVDVLGTNLGRQPTDVRQAGYLNRLGVSGLEHTGHTLDSLDVAPGSNPPWSASDEYRRASDEYRRASDEYRRASDEHRRASDESRRASDESRIASDEHRRAGDEQQSASDELGSARGLSCIHCHSPHGSRRGTHAYRNLRDDAGNHHAGEGLVTYNAGSPGTNDLSRDVFERQALRYDESAVDFNEPRRDDSALARFCAGCHGEFHGRPGDAATIGGTLGPSGRYREFVRHPAAGVDLSQRGSVEAKASATLYNQHANKVKVMSSSGAWNPVGSDATPTCVSCHKAHGNGNAFGLIFRSGKGRLTEDGDTQGRQVEHLCGQCHAEASSFANL